MGLLYFAFAVPTLLTATFFLSIIAHARFVFIGALTHLGLYKPPPDQQEPTANSSAGNSYILILDPLCPSLVPVPVHVVTAAIKNRVPVVRFQDSHHEIEESPNDVCGICLECVERVHYVRELCNCRHLFHRECLDTWIDEGQVTCPLCRSMLLPSKANVFMGDAHLDAS